MMRKRKHYKAYSKEFKEEAVRLMETTERPAAELAMEIQSTKRSQQPNGVRVNLLRPQAKMSWLYERSALT